MLALLALSVVFPAIKLLSLALVLLATSGTWMSAQMLRWIESLGRWSALLLQVSGHRGDAYSAHSCGTSGRFDVLSCDPRHGQCRPGAFIILLPIMGICIPQQSINTHY